jgi:PhzF family phenazine biosynthesis protein
MYQVDAFSKTRFSGNPAAVCVLDHWLEDSILQNIAFENNLSETAFIVKTNTGYDLRWFTPSCEVDLCGHATLASAYVIFKFMNTGVQSVSFNTLSGTLIVTIDDTQKLSMQFPSRLPVLVETIDLIEQAFGVKPSQVYKSRDLMVLFDSEKTVINLTPDFTVLSQITDCLGIIATAKGDTVDFVSRFFAPNAGVPEDPVTGRAHCILIPFWANILNKKSLHAKQVSKRGGELFCEDKGEQVIISGYATLFFKGTIYL